MGRRLRLVDVPTKPPAAPVVHVNKQLARAALHLAEGDAGRIAIISDTEVIVYNSKAQRDAIRNRRGGAVFTIQLEG